MTMIMKMSDDDDDDVNDDDNVHTCCQGLPKLVTPRQCGGRLCLPDPYLPVWTLDAGLR